MLFPRAQWAKETRQLAHVLNSPFPVPCLHSLPRP